MHGAPADPQLRCGRHTALLTAAALTVLAARLAGLSPRIAVAFLGFGALHAATLALSLRRATSMGRAVGFIVAAALLSAFLASSAFAAIAHLAARGAACALLGVAVSAFLGAAGYGTLIRVVLRYRLSVGPLAMTALACALAACAASALARRHPGSGTVYLAVCWWLAFSAGLCVMQRRG